MIGNLTSLRKVFERNARITLRKKEAFYIMIKKNDQGFDIMYDVFVL
jgi:hypothetical protein